MAHFLRASAVLLIWGLLLGHASVSKAQENALAIFNLRPTNFEAMGYDGEILYALVSALRRKKAVQLMPRREMENILSQKAMVQSDDPQMVSKAGKLLGINFILFGQVTKKGTRIISNRNLMDVRQGRVIKTWRKRFSGREDILAQMPSFAAELTRILQNSAGLAAASSGEPARPAVQIENLRALSEGKKVILRWEFDPSQPIVGFNAYRSEYADGPYQFIGKTQKSIFTDKKIKKGRTYFYRVGIILASGQEIKSEIVAEIKNAGRKIPHPPLVTGSKGFVRKAELKFVPSLLNSKEKFKITKYIIYRKLPQNDIWENIAEIDAKKPLKMALGIALGFKFEDRHNLDDGQTYTYAVSSIDKRMKESPRSDAFAITTIRRPVLALEKDNLLRKIILAWEPLENVDGYYLYRRTGQENWARVGKIKGSQTSQFTDAKTLADGQDYRYYLSAYDAQGETGPSNKVEAKTKDLPLPPGNLKSKSGLVKSVQLVWTAIHDTDIGGYAIYRGLNPQTLKRIDKSKGYESRSFLDQGKAHKSLEDGKEYFYSVASYNLFGAEGDKGPAVRARTKPRPVPVKGLKLVVQRESDTKGSITLTWTLNPEPDIEAYLVYRRRNAGFWSKTMTIPANQTRFKDSNLRTESIYRYRLIVVDKDGLKSDPAESKSIKSPVENRKGFLPKGLQDLADRFLVPKKSVVKPKE